MPPEYQQMLNQFQQQQQQTVLLVIIVQIALFVVGAWVVYMFYARLRDIANELRKMRVTYEMEQDRNARIASRNAAAATSATASGASSDEKYQPKQS